jgi:hypothetical protein
MLIIIMNGVIDIEMTVNKIGEGANRMDCDRVLARLDVTNSLVSMKHKMALQLL